MELHLRYTRLRAEYYAGESTPFFVEATANDGHAYSVGANEAKRCRCAGWRRETYLYDENEVKYRRETWTGPGIGIAFVTEEGQMIR